MTTRKTTRRRQPEPTSSNKNLMGIGGIIMLILTNYQEEIKQVEDELKDCIKSQNFEKAIELRDQLRKMRP